MTHTEGIKQKYNMTFQCIHDDNYKAGFTFDEDFTEVCS